MKPIVDGYKEAIKDYGREIDAKVTYTLNGSQVELGSEQLNSLTPHYEGGILKSVMKQLDIDSNEDIPLETQINAQFGLKVNDEYKYINLGDYIVYSSEKQEDTRSYKIIAYDKLLLSMKPYEAPKSVNLFDKDSEPYENEKYIKDDGTLVALNEFSVYKIEVKPNTQYTITNSGNSGGPGLCYYDSNDNYIGGFGYSYRANITFTTPSNTRYVLLSVVTLTTSFRYDKDIYQLQEGTEATQYEPYGKIPYPLTIRDYLKYLCRNMGIDFANANDTFVNYDKEIESELYLDDEGHSIDYTYRDVLDDLAEVTASTICINDDNELEVRYINQTIGKNLLNPIGSTRTLDNATLTNNGDGTYTINGSVSSNRSFPLSSPDNNPPIYLKANKTYTQKLEILSGTMNASIVPSFKDGNGNITYNYFNSNSSSPTSSKTPTTNMSCNTYNLYIASGSSANNCTFRVQLEENSSATDWEPYGDTIDEEYLKDINVNFGEKYGPINTITFKRSAGSDNISLSQPEDLPDDQKIDIAIQDNEILNGNDRDQFIDEILNKLYGLEYYINDYSSTGITYYDLCDRYNVKVDDKFYSCVMLNDEIQITQGLVENVHTDMPERVETDYSKTSKTDRAINQAYIIVDKVEGRIDEFVGKVNELSDLVDSQGNEITELGTRVTTTEQGWQARVSAIDSQLANGVSLVKTTSVTIDSTGINVTSDVSKTKTLTSPNAFSILLKDQPDSPLAYIGYDAEKGTTISQMDNLTIKNYFTAGCHRTEPSYLDGEWRSVDYYIGGQNG